MPLANPIGDLRDRHGIIVIGSGYGGSIMAARLAKAGHTVTLLERGREWALGALPQEESEVRKEIKAISQNPLSLFDYVVGDVDVLSGSGLGGTSLINASVVLRPSPSVLEHPRWPEEVRKDAKNGALEAYFDVVDETLEVDRVSPGMLPKTDLHEKSAKERGLMFERLPIAVNLRRDEATPNKAGVSQKPCNGCGNCVTGCNVGSKNVLTVNYLKMAKDEGAAIFTQVEVDFVAPAPEGGWVVYAKHRADDGAETDRQLHAKVVVLAAGSHGSTGILLRSRERGLPLSPRLGTGFSANGDLSGFNYNTPFRADSAGVDYQRDPLDYKVGPSITAMIDRRSDEGLIVEDGVLPRALVNLFRHHIPWFGVVTGEAVDDGVVAGVERLARVVRDQLAATRDGAVNHSMVYLAMGHDGAAGQIVLDPEGQPKVLWDGAGKHPTYNRISDEMAELSRDLGGTYYESPRWSKRFTNVPITVHPLGGCPMGEGVSKGVVDHRGHVFNPQGGFHEGLYVTDGAVLPTSLGVNPLATIAALAERSAALFLAERATPIVPLGEEPADPAAGLDPSSWAGPFIAPTPKALRVGLEFTEALSGFVASSVKGATKHSDYFAAEQKGRDEGGALRFRVRIFIDDIDTFIQSKEHEAEAIGHVESERLGRSLVIEEGKFNLYMIDQAAGEKRMIYRLRFRGDDHHLYTLYGHKDIRADVEVGIWAENTTLFTTLYEGDEQGPVLAQGVLHLPVQEFIAQLSSFRVRRCPRGVDQVVYLERFGAFFFGHLWDSYVKSRICP